MNNFSLFFFSNYEVESDKKYQLLIDCVKFADQHSFDAVWTPERHFHEFGGLFPNPSVTSAALAMITDKLQLRSGSIVSPLHNSVRIAEEWSVVDNLSGGRVEISFASGWNGHDFVLAKDNFQDRHAIMYEQIETVRKLWKGGAVTLENGIGKDISVKIYPAPLQEELPIWVTGSRLDSTFIKAGEIGANLLTHILGQDLSELGRKITLYREARAKNGFDPAEGKVAVMLHTFVHEDMDYVLDTVRRPYMDYLKSASDLDKYLQEESGQQADELPEEIREQMLEQYMLHFMKECSLIGNTEHCMEMLKKLSDVGINECACLVDFGIAGETVLQHLPNLNSLIELSKSEMVAM